MAWTPHSGAESEWLFPAQTAELGAIHDLPPPDDAGVIRLIALAVLRRPGGRVWLEECARSSGDVGVQR
jgi:hypothetical protein